MSEAGAEGSGSRWKRWAWRGLGVAALALVVGVVVARPVARWIPTTLVERGVAGRADALVVLAGDHRGGRVDFAAQVWAEGHVATGPFLVSGGQIYGETTWAEVMRERAVARGVPLERIRLQDRSTTTAEDAAFSAEILALPPGSRLLLVTSPWHSERAAEHFRRALGPEIEVTSCPSPDRPGDWWDDPQDARDLATELLKRLWWGEGG